jgi:Na+/alanine symporter
MDFYRGLCVTVSKEHPHYSTHLKTKHTFIRYLITSIVLLTLFIVFAIYLESFTSTQKQLYDDYFGMFIFAIIVCLLFLFGTILGLFLTGREIYRFGKYLPENRHTESPIQVS